jgi:hypothetical protein
VVFAVSIFGWIAVVEQSSSLARMFETAGVARTERSITNWCQPNKSGIARLDAYFDPNERRYFITPQSTELEIQEEKAKAVKGAGTAEAGKTFPNGSAKLQKPAGMESRPRGTSFASWKRK